MPASLAVRFRRHADQIAAAGRSPLTVALMRGAADDLEAGGVVAALFAGVGAPPGSVPALRLLGALHRVVLAGRARELAAFYPSAGGTRRPEGVWPAAAATLRERFAEVRARLPNTVQTNEPGRAAALYGALLWLGDRDGRPVRLLEIGASAGLNLQADRFAYVVGRARLGDPGSPLDLDEPWRGAPVPDPVAAADAVRIVHRAGCDPAPLDPADPEDRLTLMGYVWPDETARLARLRAALEVAAAHPVVVDAEPTSAWLERQLAVAPDGELTVVWESVVRQYVADAEWAGIEAAIAGAPGPVAWVRMEPSPDEVADFALDLVAWPGGAARRLAGVGNHGPPVTWTAGH